MNVSGKVDMIRVRYVNSGHRPPNNVAESFEQRILRWYDKYLKDAPRQMTQQ